jgi:hypothetical protein
MTAIEDASDRRDRAIADEIDQRAYQAEILSSELIKAIAGYDAATAALAMGLVLKHIFVDAA